MSYKIQLTVDAQLNQLLRARAKKSGLSVSSFARLALLKALQGKPEKLLDEAVSDIEAGRVESVSLTGFKKKKTK